MIGCKVFLVGDPWPPIAHKKDQNSMVGSTLFLDGDPWTLLHSKGPILHDWEYSVPSW